MKDDSLNSPKISVIIPVYNVEQYLRQCLDSIINQTYRNLEIIVVDDGSPDNCGAICDEYAEKDARVIAIHKQNGGVNTARNMGIQRASGEWLAFVDSDDWCESDYYEKMIDAAKGREADVFYAGGYYVDYPRKSVAVQTFEVPFQFSDRRSIDSLQRIILLPDGRGGAAYGYPFDKLYRASFMKQHHLLFDVSIKAWDDMWSNFKFLAEAKMIAGGPVIGYHYRQVMTSITKGYNPQKPAIMYQTISAFHDYAGQHELSDKLSEAIEETAIPAILAAMYCDYFHPMNSKTHAEIANEIRDMKTWPYFRRAIWNKKNQFLTRNQIALKYALRLPWVWPLKLLFCAKEGLNKVMGRGSGT